LRIPPSPTVWACGFSRGSVKYEVDYEKREEIEQTLKRILIELTVEGERVMALDWNHQGYWIDPRRPFLRNEEGDWMILAVPDGDYSFFIARDFRWDISVTRGRVASRCLEKT
ncbi:DUF2716 domain-containing protein, partial [Exiguobacterium sp. UBA1053]|uniref:DUF2716 domain-containing protein n=1 Tax=Exiguobacterium sp. UBA1053 TaxID=1946487 RepID=UPI0025BFA2C7